MGYIRVNFYFGMFIHDIFFSSVINESSAFVWETPAKIYWIRSILIDFQDVTESLNPGRSFNSWTNSLNSQGFIRIIIFIRCHHFVEFLWSIFMMHILFTVHIITQHNVQISIILYSFNQVLDWRSSCTLQESRKCLSQHFGLSFSSLC